MPNIKEILSTEARTIEQAENKINKLLKYLYDNSYKTFRKNFDDRKEMGNLISMCMDEYTKRCGPDKVTKDYISQIQALSEKDKTDPHKLVDVLKLTALNTVERNTKENEDKKLKGILDFEDAGIHTYDLGSPEFDIMEQIMVSGFKSGRGSSEAYNEILEDIQRLHKMQKEDDFFRKMSNNKQKMLLSTLTRGIIDKADKYISDRAEVQKNYSANSYKGKRVMNVRNVRAYLQSCLDNAFVPKSMTEDVELETREKNYFIDQMHDMIVGKTFSARVYSDYKCVADIDTGLDNKYHITSERLDRNYKTDIMQAMKQDLQGQKLATAELVAIGAMADAFEKKAEKAIRAAKPGETPKLYNKMLKYRKNFVTREKMTGYDGKKTFKDKTVTTFDGLTITGYRNIDNAVANIVFKRLDEVVKNNGLEIN